MDCGFPRILNMTIHNKMKLYMAMMQLNTVNDTFRIQYYFIGTDTLLHCLFLQVSIPSHINISPSNISLKQLCQIDVTKIVRIIFSTTGINGLR